MPPSPSFLRIAAHCTFLGVIVIVAVVTVVVVVTQVRSIASHSHFSPAYEIAMVFLLQINSNSEPPNHPHLSSTNTNCQDSGKSRSKAEDDPIESDICDEPVEPEKAPAEESITRGDSPPGPTEMIKEVRSCPSLL